MDPSGEQMKWEMEPRPRSLKVARSFQGPWILLARLLDMLVAKLPASVEAQGISICVQGVGKFCADLGSTLEPRRWTLQYVSALCHYLESSL